MRPPGQCRRWNPDRGNSPGGGQKEAVKDLQQSRRDPGRVAPGAIQGVFVCQTAGWPLVEGENLNITRGNREGWQEDVGTGRCLEDSTSDI